MKWKNYGLVFSTTENIATCQLTNIKIGYIDFVGSEIFFVEGWHVVEKFAQDSSEDLNTFSGNFYTIKNHQHLQHRTTQIRKWTMISVSIQSIFQSTFQTKKKVKSNYIFMYSIGYKQQSYWNEKNQKKEKKN